MVEMALACLSYTIKMIGDLVERLDGLGAEHQRTIWKIINDCVTDGVLISGEGASGRVRHRRMACRPAMQAIAER